MPAKSMYNINKFGKDAQRDCVRIFIFHGFFMNIKKTLTLCVMSATLFAQNSFGSHSQLEYSEDQQISQIMQNRAIRAQRLANTLNCDNFNIIYEISNIIQQQERLITKFQVQLVSILKKNSALSTQVNDPTQRPTEETIDQKTDFYEKQTSLCGANQSLFEQIALFSENVISDCGTANILNHYKKRGKATKQLREQHIEAFREHLQKKTADQAKLSSNINDITPYNEATERFNTETERLKLLQQQELLDYTQQTQLDGDQVTKDIEQISHKVSQYFEAESYRRKKAILHEKGLSDIENLRIFQIKAGDNEPKQVQQIMEKLRDQYPVKQEAKVTQADGGPESDSE